MGAGTITYSDADITLVAPETVSSQDFDLVVGDLEAALPDVFRLHAVLQEPEIETEGEVVETRPEFTATLSPEGHIQLRGRVTDEREREVVENYARANWGVDEVYGATRLDPMLPNGWSLRVLAALEAMAHLRNGQVYVSSGIVTLRGVTNEETGRAEISRILSARLGAAQNFQIDVEYVEPPRPEDLLKSPEECVALMNAVQEEQKISFDPGSADLSADAVDILDRLADVMRECEHVPMEIGGHTDSQGREQMNLNLSQARADSVLSALMARRVRVGNLLAQGYGEAEPIADNETEEGREANRRITFTLLEMVPMDPEDLSEDALEEIAASEPADVPAQETPADDTETEEPQTDEAQNEQN